MSRQPDFIALQRGFANHIKAPETVARPSDVDDRHMAIYRDLFFKNVMGFLTGAFPVLAEVIGEARWLVIGRDFFAHHCNHTPYFLEISQEFLTYLEHEYSPLASDPDYIYELAHYEWLELYVDVTTSKESKSDDLLLDHHGDVLKGVPVLAEVVEGFLYQYPVHQISLENPSPDAKPTALIVYRKRDDCVAFVETNPFTLQLLALLKQSMLSGEQAVNQLLHDAGLSGSEAAKRGGLEVLDQWQASGIIIGVCALHPAGL